MRLGYPSSYPTVEWPLNIGWSDWRGPVSFIVVRVVRPKREPNHTIKKVATSLIPNGREKNHQNIGGRLAGARLSARGWAGRDSEG